MNELPSLPRGWCWTKVREVGEVKLGRQRSPEHHSGPHMRPYLRVANVYDARIDLSDVMEMNFTPDEYEAFALRRGDVLVNEGQSLEWVGRSAIFQGEPKGACFQNTLIRFRARPCVLPEYALLVFRHYVFSQRFRSVARWTTNIAHLGSERFAEVEFPLPPVREQERIIAEADEQFSRLDDGIEALKRLQSHLKRYRASVLKAACEGKLVPTEAELARKERRECEPADKLLERILKERRAKWEADQLDRMKAAGKTPKDGWKDRYEEPKTPVQAGQPLPEGWKWTSLGQLASFVTSGSRGWAEHYAESGPLFIRAQDIKTDSLRLNEVAHVQLPSSAEGLRTRVAEGDLLVTITGANVTKSAVVDRPLPEAYVSQHVGLVHLVDSSLSRFLFLWLVSPAHGRGVLEREAYGAGKPGLNLDHLRELSVALPPENEQKRIVSEVEDRLSVLDAAEASLSANFKRAARLRQSILKRAFEGKLVPQDPRDEPASAFLERIHASREGAASPARTRKRARGLSA